MIAAPWYLLAAGIVVVIIGFFIAALSRPSGGSEPFVHHKMRDDEIARQLQRSQGGGWGNFVILFGGLLIITSLVWRFSRILF